MSDRLRDLIETYGPETVVRALAPLLSEERKARLDEVLDLRLESLSVVLEDLYDAHNGAACVRSIEAFGVQDLHVIERTHRFAAASGVAIGAQKWIDLHRHPGVASAALSLRTAGFSLCAAVPGSSRAVSDLDPAVRWAIFFGNEHEGLSEEAIAACDLRVGIPMVGFTRSLNLSVSAALVTGALAARRREWLGGRGDLPEARRAYLRARWYALGVRSPEQVVRRFVSEETRPPCGPADAAE